MAFTQFPNIGYFRIMETNEEARLGYFNLQDGTELKHMMLTIYVNGVIATPFNLRVNIYGDDTLTDPIISSDWAVISTSTLSPSYISNYLGNIFLDFAGNPLNPNINYYMTAESDDYTRNGDTFYLGINLDWYSEVNNQLSVGQAGARIRILGKR